MSISLLPVTQGPFPQTVKHRQITIFLKVVNYCKWKKPYCFTEEEKDVQSRLGKQLWWGSNISAFHSIKTFTALSSGQPVLGCLCSEEPLKTERPPLSKAMIGLLTVLKNRDSASIQSKVSQALSLSNTRKMSLSEVRSRLAYASWERFRLLVIICESTCLGPSMCTYGIRF